MSLLYRTAPPLPALSERALYHLSLDRVLTYICADVNRRGEFIDILSRLPADAEDIIYRREVLREFEGKREFFEELSSLFDRMSDLYADHRAISRDKLRLGSSGNDTIDSAKNLLQAYALCLRRALLFLCSIHDLLERSELNSEGLIALKSKLERHIKEPYFSEMTDLLASLESFKTSGALAFKAMIDGMGKLSALDLIEPGRVKITDPELKKSTFSRLFRKEEPEYPCERVFSRPNEDGEAMILATLRRLAAQIKDSSEALLSDLIPYARELGFFGIALKYIDSLSELGLPLCYPEFGDTTDIRELYDIFLAFSRRGAEAVVPNDIKIPENNCGILLFGENGSGKTVFLRSFTTAQLLAQAGLPIAAQTALLTPRTAVMTQFSEGEKEFEAGNDAGRFEQEVRELASMVDSARAGALVILNETFQTTAYTEGASGLADILKYFAKKDISFIAVTHLHELDAHFAQDEVVRMRTAEGFKVVQSAERAMKQAKIHKSVPELSENREQGSGIRYQGLR